MSKQSIHTDQAPAAIGTYSQAVTGPDGTTYISGQIPLDPVSMEIVEGGFEAQAHRVFANLSAVADAAGGTLQHCLKLTVYMIDPGTVSHAQRNHGGILRGALPRPRGSAGQRAAQGCADRDRRHHGAILTVQPA